MTNSSSQIVFVVITTIFVIICISSCSISMSATVTEAEIYGRNQQKIKCPCKSSQQFSPNHCRVHCRVHCGSDRNSPENRRLLSMRVKAAEREADRAVQLSKKPGDVSKEKLVAAEKIREYQALKYQLDHTVM